MLAAHSHKTGFFSPTGFFSQISFLRPVLLQGSGRCVWVLATKEFAAGFVTPLHAGWGSVAGEAGVRLATPCCRQLSGLEPSPGAEAVEDGRSPGSWGSR